MLELRAKMHDGVLMDDVTDAYTGAVDDCEALIAEGLVLMLTNAELGSGCSIPRASNTRRGGRRHGDAVSRRADTGARQRVRRRAAEARDTSRREARRAADGARFGRRGRREEAGEGEEKTKGELWSG